MRHTSILAFPELRGRLRRAAALRPADREHLGRLLALDPPSMLRALRLANSPLYAAQPDALSVAEVTARLGPYALARLLSVPVSPAPAPESLLKLWRHALAAAVAARTLAAESGKDPDQAYVCGLLHDLPLWLPHLQPVAKSERLDHHGWIQAWRLPRVLADCVEASSFAQTGQSEADSMPALGAAGEAVALLAGYPHSDETDELARLLGRSMLRDRTSTLASVASRIKPLIDEALAAVGIGEAILAGDRGPPGTTSAMLPDSGASLFPLPAKTPSGTAVSALLEYATEANPTALLTGVMAVAGRCLGFDRVFFLQWNRAKRRGRIRQKSDLTPTPVANRTVAPSDIELAAMERSVGATQALALRRTAGAPHALLDQLAADEVLLAPVASGGEPKGFLVLDRAYSLAELGGEETHAEISALAGVTSLLLDVVRMRTESVRTRRFAEMDGLTHLYNRRTGLELFEREIIRARRSRTPLSVLMIDMDAFKALNDRLGHLAGDSVLRTVARVLRTTFRRSDILCRYGGEEFIVVQPETGLEEATMAAARLFKAVETAGLDTGIPITVSIGVTAVNPADPVEVAIHRADRALYASKDRGRNRFSVDSDT